MSDKVLKILSGEFAGKVLETTSFRGDDRARIAPSDWAVMATFLKDDSRTQMKQFIDLTCVDWIERGEKERFEMILMVRSMSNGQRVQLSTRVDDGAALATLSHVWAGANWAEREVFDMFGVKFDGHPDLRRILMYEQFVGYPLRKDYPIEKAQPLVPYRNVPGIAKLPPFGPDMGQPFGRVNWDARMHGGDEQVSPAIAVQVGQKRNISDSEVAEELMRKLDAAAASNDGASS